MRAYVCVLFCVLLPRRFEEEKAKLYSAEIFLALEHLHGLNIIYRDLVRMCLHTDHVRRVLFLALAPESLPIFCQET